jgi:hypothetical protein
MDTANNLNNLKRHVFFEFLNLVGRAFVLVRFSENVILGSRSFSDDEKENGIILVFNSRMNFLWDEYGISATLVFGTSPQKCFIPVDDIIAIYSPELNAQFMTSPQQAEGKTGVKNIGVQDDKKKIGGLDKEAKSKNVIQVDFTKKRKK